MSDAALPYAPPFRPQLAALGIATPIDADAVAMTNHPWRFSIGALRAALGLRRLTVVNDFTALALSLPALGSGDLLRVGRRQPFLGAMVQDGQRELFRRPALCER